MTFGQVKSIIETSLIESYNNESDFKKSLKEFKHNVLSNKTMSKVYSLYDQLTTPQGLSESDAKDFLDEGVNIIQKLLKDIKLPKTISESKNEYSDIDILVYINKINLLERVRSKKKIINILTSEKKTLKETINIPIKSMVSIANQTLRGYIENLSENDKKEFLQLISEDTKTLQTKFETLREITIVKLNSILEKEEEFDMKTKISETIERIKNEKFDQLNYLNLKKLEGSI